MTSRKTARWEERLRDLLCEDRAGCKYSDDILLSWNKDMQMWRIRNPEDGEEIGQVTRLRDIPGCLRDQKVDA